MKKKFWNRMIALMIALCISDCSVVSTTQAATTGIGFKIANTVGFCPYYGLNIYPDIYNVMNSAFVECNGAAGKYNLALWPSLAHSSTSYPEMTDMYNRIYTVADPNSAYLGQTSYSYDNNGTFITADINFNMRYPFAINKDKKYYDLVSVLTHELGHVMGLKDNYQNSSYVMYHSIQKGKIKRSFSSEEIAFLHNLYS